MTVKNPPSPLPLNTIPASTRKRSNVLPGCSGSTGWARPYAATLDPADPQLRARIEAQAGNTL